MVNEKLSGWLACRLCGSIATAVGGVWSSGAAAARAAAVAPALNHLLALGFKRLKVSVTHGLFGLCVHAARKKLPHLLTLLLCQNLSSAGHHRHAIIACRLADLLQLRYLLRRQFRVHRGLLHEIFSLGFRRPLKIACYPIID